jgi:hypothetical protein
MKVIFEDQAQLDCQVLIDILFPISGLVFAVQPC